MYEIDKKNKVSEFHFVIHDIERVLIFCVYGMECPGGKSLANAYYSLHFIIIIIIYTMLCMSILTYILRIMKYIFSLKNNTTFIVLSLTG